MTETRSTPSSERAWSFLAQVARERREYIGLSQDELANYGGPGKSTVSKIERAAQSNFPPRTQQQLEKALGWERGDVKAILAHADSDYFDEQKESIAADYIEAPSPDLTEGASPARSAAGLSDDELLAELTYRFRRYALEKVGTGHVANPYQKIVEPPDERRDDAFNEQVTRELTGQNPRETSRNAKSGRKSRRRNVS